MPAHTNPGQFIAGHWRTGEGPALVSTDPATGDAVWQGFEAAPAEVAAAVAAARAAFEGWAETPITSRIACLDRFAGELRARRAALAETISIETGKPFWESLTEVDSMIGKVAISVAAYHERRAETAETSVGVTAATRFKPHGALGVFGPFNLPGHLPNGHIVPALLAGNTIVFKPSEQSPLVAVLTAEAWQAADLPPGVLNVVQGGRSVGAALAAQPDVDGLLFTGSVAGGRALARTLIDSPHKMLALEMGGNNPLVVWDVVDTDAAAYLVIQSAYLSAGQRCSCARRLILPTGGDGDRIVDRLVQAIGRIRVGRYTDRPEPFMGPVISDAAARGLLDAQQRLMSAGAIALAPMRSIAERSALLSPGLIDVTAVAGRDDTEHFGPLLQVIRVPDFDAAIAEANRTAFGLCAALVSDDRAKYDRFYRRVRTGVINFNRPTTGASSKLAFGGLGLSGNHRPSGAWATDYCSDPIASLEAPRVTMPKDALQGSGF